MICPLDEVRDEQVWGRLSYRLSNLLSQRYESVRGYALSADALGSWIQSPSVQDSLHYVYGGFEPNLHHPWGRLDRRLLWQDKLLDFGMPDGLIEEILSAADMTGPGPWLVAASPLEEGVPLKMGKARIAGSLIETALMVWADMLSRVREKTDNVDRLGGGLVIFQDEEDAESLVEHDASGDIETPGDEELIYRFGMLYNRLVRPEDPFSYLSELDSENPNPTDGSWEMLSVAAGENPAWRRNAADAMKRILSRLSVSPAVGEGPVRGRRFRQVSGMPSAPGRRSGRIERSGITPHHDGTVIVAASGELDAEDARRLPSSAGLVEYRGGRGGPGAFLCRKYGLPAVCEVENADWIPDSAQVILDGDTGIVTLEED
jgi:phosphohistidine swiveling domain-containing protein